MARGRSHAVAEDYAGEPEEPAGRGQRGSARQRAEPALRRVRMAWPAAESEHELVQCPQLLRRPLRSAGRDAGGREEVLRYLLRAEQRGAGGQWRRDGRRGDEAGPEAVRRHSVATAAAEGRHLRAAADHRKELHRRRQAGTNAGAGVRLSPSRAHDARVLRAVAARPAAGQRRKREVVSGADQGKPDRLERHRRLQLRARQQLRLQRSDAVHVSRRLSTGHQGRRRVEGGGQGHRGGPGTRHHGRRVEAGESQFPIVVPREPRGWRHPRLRARRPACRARVVRRRSEPNQHHPGRARKDHGDRRS